MPDTNPAPNGSASDPSDRNVKWYERIVVVLVLITALGVVIAAGLGAFESAAITAFFVGIAAATLTYHFLGGVGDASWGATGMKLGGAAAVLAVISGISYSQISPEFAKRDERRARAGLDAGKMTEALRGKNAEIARLNALISSVPNNDAERLLGIASASDSKTTLGRGLIDMQEHMQGPWREIVGAAQTVQISFHKKAERDDKRLFTACSELNMSGQRVRFAIDAKELTGDSDTVDAESSGSLAATQCADPDSNRVQLSCESARVMIPEFAVGCTATGEVKWAPGKEQRRFTGSAEIKRK
jgi:hypothetical protein